MAPPGSRSGGLSRRENLGSGRVLSHRSGVRKEGFTVLAHPTRVLFTLVGNAGRAHVALPLTQISCEDQ